ncbi:MAG: hypothetical protein ACOYOS_04465 [Syntrophales bacterium]
MPFEIMHFRGAEKIIQEKGMKKEIQITMEYLNDCLYGAFKKRELLRQALEEMAWRPNDDLNILDGRRYLYKGFRKRVAIDGSFSSYEYIQDALLRLQVGFDKGKIDMGIVLVTAQRSEKSPLGTTRSLLCQEIELLHPTISLPVTIVLFDLGKPGIYTEEGAMPVPDVKTEADEVNSEVEAEAQALDQDQAQKNDNPDTGEEKQENEPVDSEHVTHYRLSKHRDGAEPVRKKRPYAKSKIRGTLRQAEPTQAVVNQ